MPRAAFVSMVMLCGNGAAGAGEYLLCQIVAVLPSSTLAAPLFARAVSASLAVAVHPVRGNTPAGGAGSPPKRLISAALLQGPRFPASEVAVNRTNRALTAVNAAVFSTAVSAHVPFATGWLQVTPSMLTRISKLPIRPFPRSVRGR